MSQVEPKKAALISEISDREELLDSIVRLTGELVRIPSQSGINKPGRILNHIAFWLQERGLDTRVLYEPAEGIPKPSSDGIGVEANIGDRNGPIYCLNACADTAPIGNKHTWDYQPLSGDVVGGWLYGRGSADCKVAIAIFAHLLAELKPLEHQFKGQLSILVDADEHTGRFHGIKRYVDHGRKVAGVLIGYPGNNELKIGARGFYRVHITVYGTSQHSGTSKEIVGNAVAKAGMLVYELSKVSLPVSSESNFPLTPTLNVTAIEGGKGYTTIPDLCTVKVDMRLTPSFGRTWAKNLVKEIVAEVDKVFPTRETLITSEQSWPAYCLEDSSKLVRSLLAAAEVHFGRSISTSVSGPSNVGNYLASKGIQATCGFGVTYNHIHAANERIEINSIMPTYYTYRDAVFDLLRAEAVKSG